MVNVSAAAARGDNADKWNTSNRRLYTGVYFGNYLLMVFYVNVIFHDELRFHQWEYSSDWPLNLIKLFFFSLFPSGQRGRLGIFLLNFYGIRKFYAL